ncbi:MAG: CusA/CzcA family heavy metal efflux RND transporter [Chlorobi bacterium]|nr:CusA/CzcA family heavy metal efflux RND transporter [Chlorobiota bacterium]
MLEKIISYSVRHKLIVLLLTAGLVIAGLYAMFHIPLGAVPDITNNQVQVITTTRDLSAEDVEQFITYPIELEMSNLPGIQEIRSVSKFGLSVVTLVFEDRMGTYLPRQLIAEKLQGLGEKMPAGVDPPQMGPITTGLGEIYQYTLEVEPEYKDRYDLMTLRTIQDWIVKRNLSGIPGVVEVNTWGGKLKQFEVALDPQKLRALGVTVAEVYRALKENNGIAGGGYIEKTNKTYFIRSDGLVRDLEDIKQIVVKKNGEVPVYIKDVGEVRYGYATRFGAITGNGEGEKVMGQVMMLKGANVSEVIKNVKKRVAEISKSLPEGVYINPFLERTELLNKTTLTIAENLILGSIIVTLVVLLLLGNWRSALVIASVIPLSLLFALTMMYIFGIDANLMSLGAIDFGIIIDGAVIIVEFIAFKVALERARLLKKNKEDLREALDEITIRSASKMMHSAVFGQLIIIIVFIPILALQGVEGKMFKPMALVFIFALIGVMILGLTYLPVMSALVLKPEEEGKSNFSKKLLAVLTKWYEPIVRFALAHKKLVLGVATALLAVSIWIFTTLGGEFVPTLDEGDFVIQPVLKTGTSLQKTIETTTKIEKILLEFPEVEQVVSRIGAAEVPTDPMSMEDADIIIKLKPRKEWVTAETKDELADKFKEALSVLPGIEYEFTQPIEMRFNELISGTRSDVAVKIYGEDLNTLNVIAHKIKRKIKDIPGAADITVEKVAGLPQMKITLLRDRLAAYGINVEDVNKVISVALGGLPAGEVFEGEKRFDLVARFDRSKRQNLDDLRQIPVNLPDGRQIPLEEVARVELAEGPAKISRDATKRRISIGVNVRDRDLESVVKDIQEVIEKEIKLPPGYTITYGGQFENLRSAKKRLLLVVPVALILIFIMLYFAFGSVKLAALIYTAIPLATIGGIWALWLRDMPFSISAGIGFIALFGVAVLNGIVLIEHYRELHDKYDDMTELIIQGSKDRMRPVLLAALAAIGGFIPMAVSQSAGAEVQRPLATVVIGGLFSATLLALLVIPVLYAWYVRPPRRKRRRLGGGKGAAAAVGVWLVFLMPAWAQEGQWNAFLDSLRQRNPDLRMAEASLRAAEARKGLVWETEKTDISMESDPTNPDPANDYPYKTFTVEQGFKFPSWYVARKKEADAAYRRAEADYTLSVRRIMRDASLAYFAYRYHSALEDLLVRLDSLYATFERAASRRFELGESNRLEYLNARAKRKRIALELEQVRAALDKDKRLLARYLDYDDPGRLEWIKGDLAPLSGQPEPDAQIYRIRAEASAASALYGWKAARRNLLPDWYVSYSYGNNFLPGHSSYTAYAVGLRIPLLDGSSRARAREARWQYEEAQTAAGVQVRQAETALAGIRRDWEWWEAKLNYYRREGNDMARQLYDTARKAWEAGEIDYLHYVQTLENAMDIEKGYLEAVKGYNEALVRLRFFVID